MKIIFCEDPVFEHEPDSMVIDELAAASRAGLQFELIDYEALRENNNAARAVRSIAVRKPIETAIYRGWPLNLAQYSVLYDALLSRGLKLINNGNQYRYTQSFPSYYPLIKAQSPRSFWVETDGKGLAYPAIMQMLLAFASQPIILRDYAKAEKYYWAEACYISSASDAVAVQRAVERFLERRGKDFEGGLVFREFVEFISLEEQSAHNLPRIKEYRLLYLNGLPLMSLPYWEFEGQENNPPPLDLFANIAQKVQSRFFTMDVAQRPNGEWLIIDLGDGQVANLPNHIDLDTIYRALAGAG